jgi:hypothetical protein
MYLGHNAHYTSYVVLENGTGCGLVTEFADKRETNFNSCIMEYYTYLRCMHRIVAWKITIEAWVSDQNPQVMKFLRMYIFFFLLFVLHVIDYIYSFLISGMLAENLGRRQIATSRKANDSAQNDLQKALEGRNLTIAENEIEVMGDIIPCLDIW